MTRFGDRALVEAFRAGAAVSRRLPDGVIDELAAAAGRAAAATLRSKRSLLVRHLRRVHGPGLRGLALERAVQRSFESYARYYAESFRLPSLSPGRIEAGIVTSGTEHIWRGLDAGRGVILAMPHLGGWEWAAFWLTAVKGRRVSAVVEALEPPELFEWFTAFRRSIGVDVIPLGPEAGPRVMAALGRNEVVALLCDRDLTGTGVEVDFFGERTSLPAGPVTIGLRSQVPVLPTAVYFRPGGGHLGVVRPPLTLQRQGRLRADVAAGSQALAQELELLIRAAPEQWHLLQPNWPSDRAWLAARRHRRPATVGEFWRGLG